MPFLSKRSKKYWVKTLISFYRLFFSPFLHALFGPPYGCRFIPTCSTYASEAIELHGWGYGLGLAIRRILRCHPFARSGYDPVPRDIAHKVPKTNKSVLGR